MCPCHLQVLRVMLAAGADLNICSKSEGLTALHFAAIFGHSEVANALIEHGASTIMLDGNGHTAADIATVFGHQALATVISLAPIVEVSIGSAPVPKRDQGSGAGHSTHCGLELV